MSHFSDFSFHINVGIILLFSEVGRKEMEMNFLEIILQVASATATFVMMFSSSLSVVEFYILKRFPIPYGIYLTTISFNPSLIFKYMSL